MDIPIPKTLQQINMAYGKSYEFSENHPVDRVADYWFQYSSVGPTLFIVFYTQACRWSRCLGCNLPSISSTVHVPFHHLNRQVDQIFTEVLTARQKKELRKMILSNNGSVLDEATFSTTSLLYFTAMMNIHCPNIAELAIESRPEFVDMAELEVLSRALSEGDTPTKLEIAIGFEAFDDRIRNEHFHKGMSLEVFEDLASKLAQYKFQLKTYFMLKPVPGMSDEDAIEDIRMAIVYLDHISQKYGFPINLHLNPTFVAKGTLLEQAFLEGRYTPPHLETVRQATLHARNCSLTVFIGLNDEGLAIQGGSFLQYGEESLLKRLEKFNRTQDYRILEETQVFAHPL